MQFKRAEPAGVQRGLQQFLAFSQVGRIARASYWRRLPRTAEPTMLTSVVG